MTNRDCADKLNLNEKRKAETSRRDFIEIAIIYIRFPVPR